MSRIQVVVVVVVMIAASSLPGCAVGEIRDELTEINATLVLVQADLAALRKTSGRIAQMDEEMEQGINRLDTMGDSLTEVDNQLKSVTVSLRDLDVHLASLRRSLQKIDRTVPFVDIADDAEVKDPEAPAEETPKQK